MEHKTEGSSGDTIATANSGRAESLTTPKSKIMSNVTNNSIATASTAGEAPSTTATEPFGAQPKAIPLFEITSGTIDESQQTMPAASILSGDYRSTDGFALSQALASFHSTVPLPDIPVPSVDQEHSIVTSTTVKAKTTDVDVQMLNAGRPSPPHSTNEVPSSNISDTSVQILDADSTPASGPAITDSSTPLGSPANSVPDRSCRNKSII